MEKKAERQPEVALIDVVLTQENAFTGRPYININHAENISTGNKMIYIINAEEQTRTQMKDLSKISTRAFEKCEKSCFLTGL